MMLGSSAVMSMPVIKEINLAPSLLRATRSCSVPLGCTDSPGCRHGDTLVQGHTSTAGCPSQLHAQPLQRTPPAQFTPSRWGESTRRALGTRTRNAFGSPTTHPDFPSSRSSGALDLHGKSVFNSLVHSVHKLYQMLERGIALGLQK